MLFGSWGFAAFLSFAASLADNGPWPLPPLPRGTIDLEPGFGFAESAIFGGGWLLLFPCRSSVSLFGDREEVRGNLLVPLCAAWDFSACSSDAAYESPGAAMTSPYFFSLAKVPTSFIFLGFAVPSAAAAPSGNCSFSSRIFFFKDFTFVSAASLASFSSVCLRSNSLFFSRRSRISVLDQFNLRRKHQKIEMSSGHN